MWNERLCMSTFRPRTTTLSHNHRQKPYRSCQIGLQGRAGGRKLRERRIWPRNVRKACSDVRLRATIGFSILSSLWNASCMDLFSCRAGGRTLFAGTTDSQTSSRGEYRTERWPDDATDHSPSRLRAPSRKFSHVSHYQEFDQEQDDDKGNASPSPSPSPSTEGMASLGESSLYPLLKCEIYPSVSVKKCTVRRCQASSLGWEKIPFIRVAPFGVMSPKNRGTK